MYFEDEGTMISKMLNNRVIIVFGDDMHNTYGVIRSLGEAGILPYFIDVNTKEESFVEKSRYLKQSWRVETVEKGVAILIEQFGHEEQKPVVICTSDPTIHAIDIQYDVLESMFIIPNVRQKQGEITRLMDKNVMRQYAKYSGFELINNLSLDLTNFEDSDLNCVNYPCLIKPTTSLEGSKKDIRICRDRTELNRTLKELSNHVHVVEIQDYIKKDIELLLLGAVLRSGEVIMPLFWGKKREDPKLEGSTAWAICTKDFPGFDIRKVQIFFDAIGYYGLFSIEYLVKGGKHYFLEVNLRNDGNGYAPTFGGVNLPYIWVMDALGYDVSGFKRHIVSSFHAQIETTDFGYILRKPYKILSWLYDTIMTECYMVASSADPDPWKEKCCYSRNFFRKLYCYLYLQLAKRRQK